MKGGRVTFPLSLGVLHRLLELDPSEDIVGIGGFDPVGQSVSVTVWTPKVPEGDHFSTPVLTEHPRRIVWDWGIPDTEEAPDAD